MVRTIIFTGRARFILCAILLMATLAACGGGSAGSADTAAPPAPSPASPSASTDAGGPGIDQTKLDVCALLPRDQVEAAIGALAAMEASWYLDSAESTSKIGDSDIAEALAIGAW